MDPRRHQFPGAGHNEVVSEIVELTTGLAGAGPALERANHRRLATRRFTALLERGEFDAQCAMDSRIVSA